MKYKNFISIAFIALLFLPLLSAKTEKRSTQNFDVRSIEFIKLEQEVKLDFDTAKYLPENFDPYENKVAVKSINFLEDETVELGFDTADYLPEGFDPYIK